MQNRGPTRVSKIKKMALASWKGTLIVSKNGPALLEGKLESLYPLWLAHNTRGQEGPKLGQRGAQKSFSEIKRGSESRHGHGQGRVGGKEQRPRSSSCKKSSTYRISKEAGYLLLFLLRKREMPKKSLELDKRGFCRWQGNKGGRGDADV